MRIRVKAESIRGEVVIESHPENGSHWGVQIKGYYFMEFDANAPGEAVDKGLALVPFLRRIPNGAVAASAGMEPSRDNGAHAGEDSTVVAVGTGEESQGNEPDPDHVSGGRRRRK